MFNFDHFKTTMYCYT